jgi:DNA-binding GntR family transcriptional regulator
MTMNSTNDFHMDDAVGEDQDQNLAQKAHQGIRRMMFLNQIAPGQKINLRDLAGHLRMSPTPVIQALKWLEYQGLVSHERHRGYSYKPISIDEVRELYDLRVAIECSLLPDAVANATPEGLERARQAYEDHTRYFHEQYVKRALMADMDFHLALATMSGSRIGVRFLRELFELFYLKYQAEQLFIRNLSRAITSHRCILERVSSRDPEGAREALSDHIREVRDTVLKGMRLSAEENKDLQL